MPGKEIDRRTVLKATGATGLSVAALPRLTEVVRANEGSDIDITRDDDRTARKAATRSQEFKRLKRRLKRTGGFRVVKSEATTFRRVDDDETLYVVSYPVVSKRAHGRETLRNGDVAVLLDDRYEVTDAKANLTFGSDGSDSGGETVTYATDGSSVNVQTQAIGPDGSNQLRSSSVTAQGASCSQCKNAYDVICSGPGCNLGYATICYLIGGGLAGAWCGALVGDLCDFIDENSCEAGTNQAVCELLGYCSSGGDDPCDQFEDGVDSPYCDA